MQKTVVLISCAFMVIALFVGYKISQVPSAPVHYHANFAVFEGGKQVDFSSPEFMHISPCTENEVHSDDPNENVHLHDGIGNVVHVHADSISWKTLFETLKYWDRLEKTHESSRLSDLGISIYVDGKDTSYDVLTTTIVPQTHLLISIDSQAPSTDSARLKRELDAVGNNAKEYDEGKIGIEKCGSTGKRSLWERFTIAFGL